MDLRGSVFGRARVALLLALLGSLLVSGSAAAAITTPFGPGGPSCAPDAGDRVCEGVVETFDGAPIDVRLRLPGIPAGPLDPDGPYPLVMGFHGWGGDKTDYNLDRWVNRGYAAFSMSDRGWGASCGGADPKRLTPQCTGIGPGGAKGYNHLMDTRYEVRDAQYLAGLLVDNGVAIPDKIGATGGSYGGGMSMALAALNDRTMLGALPGETNGELVAWESPGGTPMQLAAAAPSIPWTDLAYSLVPNGGTLDYAVDSTYDKRAFGVMKQSFVTGLYGIGVGTSNFAPPGTDPTADVHSWYALLTAGEPYEGNPLAEAIAAEVTRFHSSYYIDHSRPPAPLLISNGFTDDLFPVDEAIRFYNRTRNQYPGADISMLHFDYGHQRGQNKPADTALLRAREEAWFDHYLRGIGPEPANQVETLTQVCGGPSEGPFAAPTWAAIAPGEIRVQEAESQTILPDGGNPLASQAYDPIAGGGACATADASDSPGAASYRLDPAPAGGYTLMGSPTVIADILNVSPSSQVVSRLIDVDPATGEGTLVARGVYRPDAGAAATRQVFQLHPNGYRFAPGHIAKLELLPSDTPYARKSNGQGPITVSNLDFRLPVLESPGAPGVTTPAPKFVPPGYELSSDYGPPSSADSDGDGIADADDACPNEVGPASNNGCPLPASAGPAETAGCGEALRGTSGKDSLRGTGAADRISGKGGKDRIKGRGGADCLRGGSGDDRIGPGAGSDIVRAGRDDDRVNSRDGEADEIACGPGRDRVRADRADDLKSCESVRRR